MTETAPQNASERPVPPRPGTSDRVKCFKKHCLRCRNFYDHRHTPAEYNKPCKLCPCTYFYGWEQRARGMKLKSAAEFAKRRKAPQTVELFAGETPKPQHTVQ